MSHQHQTPDSLADPLSLSVLHAAFRSANNEFRRRLNGQEGTKKKKPARRNQASRIAAALNQHFKDLDFESLDRLRSKLAGNLLLEVDRKIATPGSPPGERLDAALVPEAIKPTEDRTKLIGLVSLPWMSPAMPSIQLATLAAALEREGIASDVHELYVNYSARIGLNLYNYLGNLLGYLPEWIFSRHYYGPEQGDDLSRMFSELPADEILWPEYGQVVLEALEPITKEFLDDVADNIDWTRYDILGCSLTISQLGASMAFVRRVKLRHPHLKIIFGGSQCAGPMGRAILRICPYVDVVVHVEGELVLGDLVKRLRNSEPVEGMPGVSCRQAAGEIVTGDAAGLYRPDAERLPLNYDPYFKRLTDLDLVEKIHPWLPFEGSRGCWYGQKVQCTFCGLHEIMEFRAWKAEAVLAELERLYARYRIGRFYAMDLIMPREYLRTFLPEVASRGHDWRFFWEIKSNMRREDLEILAAAGVRWIQPGIESLDRELLRLMKKGVTPLQNILLLKWCEELSIFCGWNLIFGLPGETSKSYDRMNELIPKLFHLRPPSGGGDFQLHRFSPYFDHPDEYGIHRTGAHRLFKFAFPIAKQDLDDLVYLHEFFSDQPGVETSATLAAVEAWRRAYERGATLEITVRADGSSLLTDTRQGDASGRVYELTEAETALYLFLDGGRKLAAVQVEFPQAHRAQTDQLNRSGSISSKLDEWIENDLILVIDGQAVSLALYSKRTGMNTGQVSHRPISFASREGVPANLPI